MQDEVNEKTIPCRPEEPQREERASRINRKTGGGLQAKGFNRYPLALGFCPTR